MRACVLTCAQLLLMTTLAWSATYTVNPEGTGDFPTIQLAVEALQDGDIIELTDGIFTGDGNRDIDCLAKSITIRSISGDPEMCIIDCEGSAEEPHRGFHYYSEEVYTARLEGMTIRNGWITEAPIGGAILCEESARPGFQSCIFRNNRRSAITCLTQSQPRVYDCHFEDNFGQDGGAVWALEASPIFLRCTFTDNQATSQGGAIGGHASGPEITDCQFVRNKAYTGGALSVFCGADPLVTRCLFQENWAHLGGAAQFFCFINGHFIDCTFVGNSSYGAGVLSNGKMTNVSFTNCTLWGNRTENGGALRCGEHGITLHNTIIAGSPQGAAITGECIVTLVCCDIFGNAGGDWVGPIADQLGIRGNICMDPAFCDPEQGDFRLWNYSPCIQENCGLIGAWSVGCTDFLAAPAEAPGERLRLEIGTPLQSADQTRITYALPGNIRAASLSIYDATGRLVRMLAHELTGSGEIRWDGRDAAGRPARSGPYIARLSADGQAQQRRWVLIR